MIVEVISTSGQDLALRNALIDAELPVDDIGDTGRSFFRIERDGELVGYAGYELYGTDALIRSIVVPLSERGKGLGRVVTEALLEQVHARGGRRAYLLTTSAADFFQHLGFTPIPRSEAPQAILGTRQASSICTSAAMLSREI